MKQNELQSIKGLCEQEINTTANWLVRSITMSGGSRASYTPFIGWSGEYPETSGYIMPTLYKTAELTGDQKYFKATKVLMDWLLSIQNEQGYWLSGHEKSKNRIPSVFNTAQILLGLSSMFHYTGDESLLDPICNSGRWLSSLVDLNGIFTAGSYQGSYNPSYYTRVAWPMLEAGFILDDKRIIDKATKVLSRINNLRNSSGYVDKSEFIEGQSAFTHTIAYTLRGFIESARILNSNDYDITIDKMINKLYVFTGKNRGALPGEFNSNFEPTSNYVCLTGNAQVAICMFHMYEKCGDLRLVDCAVKLIDTIQNKKSKIIQRMLPNTRGAIAGSSPFLGRYMRGRFPNWAAKFYLDALLLKNDFINQELC